ncbi:aspartyl-phosphate phosphatase Spo0E family protein [Wukongibacter baidiensis]|uniref:aspartyl-phosphate phosphatase Spo0E family protein n=1 Tax=Wukongibacter baidiensis TaxID=1723361 RepID=UPI003D7F351C
MNRVRDIESEIEKLRDKLYWLINETTLLCDSKVVEISKELDEVLNVYNDLDQHSRV